jgi:Prokaryotic E2 family E
MAKPSPRAVADLACLTKRHPDAQTKELENGNVWVAMDLPLPSGWGVPTVKLWFLVPQAYPATPPDCFWVEPKLKINGAVPHASNDNTAMPDLGRSTQWFSWHINDQSQWDGNRDTLITWVTACRKRFDELK